MPEVTHDLRLAQNLKVLVEPLLMFKNPPNSLQVAHLLLAISCVRPPKKQTNKQHQKKMYHRIFFFSKGNCFECCNDDLTVFWESAARIICHIFLFFFCCPGYG